LCIAIVRAFKSSNSLVTDAGYPAVRLTSASENFADQHSVIDTLANASVPYATRAARMNAAVAASLAFAPAPPVVDWTFPFSPDRAKGSASRC
jgi:hypothetical protein